METYNTQNTAIEEEQTSKGLVLLDKAYELALNGIPLVSESIQDLVNPYIKNSVTKDDSI